MNKKFIPFSILALLALVGCNTPSTPTTFKVDNPQTGLGSYTLVEVDEGSYQLTVTPIPNVTVKEVKVNDVTVTLDEGGNHTFKPTKGENTISIEYNTPTLDLDFLTIVYENHLSNREVTSLAYTSRTFYVNTIENEIDTDLYTVFSTNFYSNGVHADVTIGSTGVNKLTGEEGFAYVEDTGGTFVTYQLDEEYYYRALVPEKYHEDGYVDLLERSSFFDETTEDLGYYQFLDDSFTNLSGEYTYPEDYGYVNALTAETTDAGHTYTLTATCTAVDYGDYVLPEEVHRYNITLDPTSYEIASLVYDGRIYRTDATSDVVTIYETRYENIEVGKLVEGDIPEITSVDTIDPRYVTLHKPTIQSDLSDGELTKADALKVLDNIWAYSENTKQTKFEGPAYAYDQDYNEISGTGAQTITAYQNYFLNIESTFTPDDPSLGGTTSFIEQHTLTEAGVQVVNVQDGVVDPYGCYINTVTKAFSFKQNFSASPLIHDFTVQMAVAEALQYGLQTTIEESEGGSFGVVYENFTATKDGGNMTIKWSAAMQYDGVTDGASYYQVIIEDNFVTEIAYGESFEDYVSYEMVQGEYEVYTGTIYEFVEPEW